MKIAIVGTGYVGLVTGACFAETGIDVICIDINAEKIEQLRRGVIPIYEPGLDDLVAKNVKAGRLHFATSLPEVIAGVEVIFSAVGTPPDETGCADLKHVFEVAREIGRTIDGYKVIVTKSTVPVGTSRRVAGIIAEEIARRGESHPFDVVSNPEFLKEGDAIADFSKPDRIVVGAESERAKALMKSLYKPFSDNGHAMIYMDVASAEMTKYAANAMLATRISFMNDIANLCEIVGANVNLVRKGISLDERIGDKFLNPGCGYGGSCFPKDVKALASTGREQGYEMRVVQAVDRVNEDQKRIVFEKLQQHYNADLQDKRIAVWGLSYKPRTDDMRDAPALVVVKALLDAGCRVCVYDPVAMEVARRHFGDRVEYAKDIYTATKEAEAILLLTEWKEFRMPNWERVRRAVKTPLVIDGRNIYDRTELQNLGFFYMGIGV